jgi:hypothetical protein
MIRTSNNFAFLLRCMIFPVLILALCQPLSFARTLPAAGKYRGSVDDQILLPTKHLDHSGFGKKTTVVFSLLRDGSLKDLKVLTKSGSSEHDARALESVKACMPFKPAPPGSPPEEKHLIDINYNAHTWESHCIPCGLEISVDEFLDHLAHRWNPPRMREPGSTHLKFTVEPGGKISRAALEPMSCIGGGFDGVMAFLFDEITLFQMSLALQGQCLPPNTTVSEISVQLDYDPGPIEVTGQPGHLINGCGLLFGDSADGKITFHDPH